jgi:SH3-like domain-containing protein
MTKTHSLTIPTRILALAAIAALSSAFAGGPAHAQVVEGEEHCVVNVKASDALNLRAKGSASSKIVSTLPYGECGIVVTDACQGAWCPVEDGHDAGWVHSRFISMVSPSMYCVTGVGSGDLLNLRAYPSANSRILTKLPRQQCDIAFLPYSTGTWQKVRVEGYEGWANRKYLSGQ